MRGRLLFAAVLVASCTSQTMERNATGMWTNSESRREEARKEPEPEAPREPPKGTVVSIPADVASQFQGFSDRPSTIFADVVEMDLSRNGWLSLMSLSVSPDAVTRTDQEDPQRGVLTISLRRNEGAGLTPDAIPTVRFGNGLRVVGVERVVLRFWTQQSVERPIWCTAIAAGKKAVYQVDGQPPQEWRGTSVTVSSEIHKVGGAYRFDSSVEKRP